MNKPLFHKQLLAWYDISHRILPWRETGDAYKIWISEIILQQTRVAQGLDYYLRFIARFPDVKTLAQADEAEVLLLWQGLGYYSRARNLHKAAQQIVERHDGCFPTDYNDVRALQGIGDYTAAAICSFAYNAPYAVLDGNVYRVLARLFDEETPMDTGAGKRLFHALAADILNHEEPSRHNQAIMEFGALYCTPQNPDCEHCPIQMHCLAFAHHTVEMLPVRKPIAPLKDRYLNYFIFLSYEKQTLIHRREGQDIWKHLYEFPLREATHLFTPQEAARAISGDAEKHSTVAYRDFTHVLSHQRLHARFFYIPCETLPCLYNAEETYQTIAWETLSDYAFSRLTLRALEDKAAFDNLFS